MDELSPEEQSFFEAGDALEGPRQPEGAAPQRLYRRRRSRRHSSSRLSHKLRRSGWPKVIVTTVLAIGAVWVGYWASMLVANRDIPDPSELGVEKRGH
jgi:hypothetical protein